MKAIVQSILMVLVMTLLLGVGYPFAITGLAALLFPKEANGSLLERDGKAVGSALVGQPFDDAKYFWGRPSATAPMPYNGGASSGSNLGPLNPALADAVKARVDKLRVGDPDNKAAVPVDLVTASGSGLDPHISPEAAAYQVARIARVRGLDRGQVQDLVARQVEPRQLGFLGEPRVNVLRLNLALDAIAR